MTGDMWDPGLGAQDDLHSGPTQKNSKASELLSSRDRCCHVESVLVSAQSQLPFHLALCQVGDFALFIDSQAPSDPLMIKPCTNSWGYRQPCCRSGRVAPSFLLLCLFQVDERCNALWRQACRHMPSSQHSEGRGRIVTGTTPPCLQ